MRQKQQLITNHPTLVCANCKKKCDMYVTYTSDDDGNLTIAQIDAWPEYFSDNDGIRTEFCSAKCGLEFLSKQNN